MSCIHGISKVLLFPTGTRRAVRSSGCPTCTPAPVALSPSPRCVVRPLLRWQKERQERESQREHAEVVRESRAQVGRRKDRRGSRFGGRRGKASERLHPC